MHPEILGYTNSKVHIVPTFRGSKVAHAWKEKGSVCMVYMYKIVHRLFYLVITYYIK